MKTYFCGEYPEIGRVKCASIAEARKIFNCDCDGKPCCEGPITLEELIAKTQKNIKTWAKNKKNEMDKMYTANMAFIAAAPEMLEALEEVKEYIEHSMNYGILAGVPEFVESAIQKARGEENKPEDDLEEYLDGEPVKSLVDFLLPLLTKLNRLLC